jgi:uncharacterized damage-inducible protein DinB
MRMTRDDLLVLLDYHYWARDRVLAAVAPLSRDQYTQAVVSSFRSLRDTIVHTYAAERVWYQRCQGESPTGLIPGERFPDVQDIRAAWSELEAKVRADFAARDAAALSAVVPYRLFSGKEGATPFAEILQHVVNHASYHRGQVTTLLRQLGAAPPESLDLITFYRLHA